MPPTLLWQLPLALLTGLSSFYLGSSLSSTSNFNLCCFTSAILLFASLLIFLPQIHLRSLLLFSSNKTEPFEQQDDIFPVTFAATAIIFSLCLLIQKIALRMAISKGNTQKHYQRTFQNIRYLIPVASSFLLFNSFFYNPRDTNTLQEFIIALFTSSLINFSQGHLHSWTGPKNITKRHVGFLSNIIPIVAGMVLGGMQDKLMALSLLGLIGVGVTLYVITMLVFPILFECENQAGGKFASIVGGFLVTVIYYPLCHLVGA